MAGDTILPLRPADTQHAAQGDHLQGFHRRSTQVPLPSHPPPSSGMLTAHSLKSTEFTGAKLGALQGP